MANYSWDQFDNEQPEQMEQQPYHWGQFDEGERYESQIPSMSPQVQAYQQLIKEYPMPESWMRGLISMAGTKKHPYLEMAANIAEPIGKAAKIAALSRLGAPLIGKAFSPLVEAAKTIIPRVAGLKKYGQLREQQENLGNQIEGLQENAITSDEAYNLAKNEAQQLEEQGAKKIGSYLNKGATHNVRAAQGLSHRMGNIEKYWSDAFKTLRSDLKNNNFQMNELPKYEINMNKIFEQIKSGADPSKINAAENSELAILRNKAPTPKDISAEDFLTKYQSFRDARYDLLQRAKSARDATERRELFDAYKNSKPMEETINQALEEGLGDYGPEYKRVNQGYSKQIFPLRSNKVIQSALKGKLSQNMLEEVAGNDETMGQVRELIKQDPELLRNILGQRYASNPKGLQELDEKTAEFLSEMPELEKILQENESELALKIKEANAYKAQKELSLKQKMEAEKQAKKLKETLSQIEKDRAILKKWGKRVGKAALYGLAAKGGYDYLKRQ